VMLDLFGVLPTVLESKYFVSDTDSKKRDKVVKWLVQAPEYQRRAMERHWMQYLTQGQMAPATAFWGQSLVQRSATPMTGGPDRLDQLLAQVLAEKKSDEQILEVLYLATMGRYPTNDAKRVILAQLGKQTDRAAAWNDVLHALTQSKDARDYADALKRRAGR